MDNDTDDATAENKRVYIASAANDNLPRYGSMTSPVRVHCQRLDGWDGTLSRDSEPLKRRLPLIPSPIGTTPRSQTINTQSPRYRAWSRNGRICRCRHRCSGTGVTFNGYSAYTDGVISADHTQVLKWVDGTSSAVDNITTGTAGLPATDETSPAQSGASQVLRVWRDSGAGWVQMGSDISDATHQSGGAPGIHVGYTATPTHRWTTSRGEERER